MCCIGRLFKNTDEKNERGAASVSNSAFRKIKGVQEIKLKKSRRPTETENAVPIGTSSVEPKQEDKAKQSEATYR